MINIKHEMTVDVKGSITVSLQELELVLVGNQVNNGTTFQRDEFLH